MKIIPISTIVELTSDNLKDIYEPLGDNIVFEFIIKSKTQTNNLPLNEDFFAKKIIAIGTDVKHYKIGDWVLINPAARITQIPLIYNGPTGLQHGQIHEFEALGKVDTVFMETRLNHSSLTSIN